LRRVCNALKIKDRVFRGAGRARVEGDTRGWGGYSNLRVGST
jgi:hypothetical protein